MGLFRRDRHDRHDPHERAGRGDSESTPRAPGGGPAAEQTGGDRGLGNGGLVDRGLGDRGLGDGARAATSGEEASRDEAFPFLSAAAGRRFRVAVRAAFAERGLETDVHADHVQASSGVRFGLHNLAAACRASGGESAWPETIAAHVRAVVLSAQSPDALERGDREAVLRDVVLRVMGASTLPQVEGLDYARSLGGDLVEVLALDLPSAVHLLSDHDLERYGEDTLRQAGLANLLAQPYDSYDHLRLDGGADLHVIAGDSVYVASRLLVLPDLLRRVVGRGEEVPTPHGLLVSASTRHQLAFHIVRDSGVVTALQALVPATAQEFEAGVGGISPWVYWWHEGRLHQVSSRGEDGGLRVEVTTEFAAALEAVIR